MSEDFRSHSEDAAEGGRPDEDRPTTSRAHAQEPAEGSAAPDGEADRSQEASGLPRGGPAAGFAAELDAAGPDGSTQAEGAGES